jgi:hypothetical protein
MSIDSEIEQGGCHVATRDDFLARIQTTNLEQLSFGSVIDDIPPDECAAMHPESLKEGLAYPDTEGSLVVKAQTGYYSFAGLAQEGVSHYRQFSPEVELGFGGDIPAMEKEGLSFEFGIASLAMGVEEPKPAEPTVQTAQDKTLEDDTPKIKLPGLET